jgi:hypothetical protein
MNADNTDRRIQGLAPRAATPDLSRLLRKNRNDETLPDKAGEDSLSKNEQGQAPNYTSADTPGSTAAITPEPMVPQDTDTKRMTVYLATRHYARARAAYRATNYAEGDRSWSDFVEKAVLAEAMRRETLHHNDAPYEPDSSPLSAGRPLSS